MEKVGRVGWFYMIDGELDIVKASMWEVPRDFKCRKPEFAEYLNVAAPYDQQQRMGQMYWAVREDKIVGYMMLAMGHVGKRRQADLGIDTYGPVPALVITRLATDERHERSGIGRHMTSYAVGLAGRWPWKRDAAWYLPTRIVTLSDSTKRWALPGFSKGRLPGAAGPRLRLAAARTEERTARAA